MLLAHYIQANRCPPVAHKLGNRENLWKLVKRVERRILAELREKAGVSAQLLPLSKLFQVPPAALQNAPVNSGHFLFDFSDKMTHL